MKPAHRPLVRTATAALALALGLALGGCGSQTGSGGTTAAAEVSATPTAQVTAEPPAAAKRIAITLTADTVDPDGTRITVTKDQPVVLDISADKAGELHVHSTPEQHISFPAGASRIELRFDQPGVVDIEDHALDKLIVQLEVR